MGDEYLMPKNIIKFVAKKIYNMPAKLDITKPLRLIGIQIFEDTLSDVRKALEPGWYPLIKCKRDIGTSKDSYPEVSDDGCP